MSEPVVAIVVAAGSGVRLGDSTAGGTGPKALRLLAGVPLVRRSVDAMAAGGATECVVVANPEWRASFDEALAGARVPVRVVDGGATRQESVSRGLAALVGDAVVLVHDAARPLVPADVVAAVVASVASGAEAAVPVVPVTDSVRELTGADSAVVDRSRLRAVQTPQGFALRALRAAHERARAAALAGETTEYTDDAAVCEAAGLRVELVPGSRLSMKITEPVDFAVAEALLTLKETP